MMFLAVLAQLVLCAIAGAAAADKPNIIMVLVDDNGWAGVGYNNPHINTPHLDALAADGLKLTRHYVYQYCAPTRGSFLTGRFPYKLAATRANFIPWTLPDGTHLSYAMLPKKLKPAGYRSVHIGKWHQGLYTPQYTPVGRGFDYSFGFLEGGEDHNMSTTFGNYCKHDEVDLSYGAPNTNGIPYPYAWPACAWKEIDNVAFHNFYDSGSVDIVGYNPLERTVSSAHDCKAICENRIDCIGYSWRKVDPTSHNYHRCFFISATNNSGVANEGFTSAICFRNTTAPPAHQEGVTTIPAVGKNGTYTGILFADEAVRVVREHAVEYATQPLFMYYAMHDTHAPLEAPWSYVAPYVDKFPGDTKRQIFSGMISFVDEAVLNLTAALKSSNMWNNTLFIWTNDNGSPVAVGGSNYPLKGGKGSDWEGGTRVATFVAGGFLPRAQAGKEHDGLMYICDWHATICDLAGVDPTAGEPNAVAPLDGISAWPWISGQQPHSDRHEIVYSHRMFENASIPDKVCHRIKTSSGVRCAAGAIQIDGWKLIVGPIPQASWFGWFSPNISSPINKSSPIVRDTTCLPGAPCLYNLNASMTEHEDVADQNPDVLAAMLRRFDELAEEYHPPIKNPPIDVDGYCGAIARNKNFVGPWMQVPLDQLPISP
eukprot:m.1375855 g.1375855  ORF g.1375855 m.1375855 type:complete len:654 (+) comp24961_c0_seq4:97-2058(+)